MQKVNSKYFILITMQIGMDMNEALYDVKERYRINEIIFPYFSLSGSNVKWSRFIASCGRNSKEDGCFDDSVFNHEICLVGAVSY